MTAPSAVPAFAAAPGAGKKFWILGQALEIRVSSKDTDGAYAVTEAEAAPGWSGAPPHIHHHEDELVHVLAGELLFTIDGREIRAGTGSLVHIPRGALHSFANQTDMRSRLLTVYTPGGFEEWFEEVGTAIVGGSDRPPAEPPDRERLVAAGAARGLEIASRPAPQ